MLIHLASITKVIKPRLAPTKVNRVFLLAAIAGTAILVPCHVVQSLQLIWRLGTRWWNLWPPALQMSCSDLTERSQIAKFMGPTWGPPGSCRPQIGPMLAPWSLLSGMGHQGSPWSLSNSCQRVIHYSQQAVQIIVTIPHQLTHSGQDKMATISQMTFSSAFS